jgi:exopolysaccharide production protein ExoQ
MNSSQPVQGTARRARRTPAKRASRGPAGGNSRPLLITTLIWSYMTWLIVRWDWMNAQTNDVMVDNTADLYAASSLTRAIKIVVLVIGLALVARQMSKARIVVQQLNRPFIVFSCLVPISAAWSISPSDTLLRFLMLISVLLICLAATSSSWHRTQFQGIVRPLINMILAGSLVVGLMYPHWIIEQGEGTLKNSWHGLLNSKNAFGQAAAFGLVFSTHLWLEGGRRRWLAVLQFALAMTCLLLSRSSTSLLSAVFAVCAMLAIHHFTFRSRKGMRYIVAFFSAVVSIYGLAVLRVLPGLDLLFKPIAMLTGKDQTFSARSMIWEIIEKHIALSPLLGTGYGGYWIGEVPTSPSFVFLSLMYFYPFEAHNGYLDIINDLGYVGLLCLSGYLIVYVRQCVDLFKWDKSQAILFVGLFFMQALINLSESTWLNVASPLSFVIMTFATFALARSLADGKSNPVAARQQMRTRGVSPNGVR